MLEEQVKLDKLKRQYDMKQLQLEYGDYAWEILRYHERIKQGKKKTYNKEDLQPSNNNTYFDCETYESYRDPSDPHEQPIIIPYLIGCYYCPKNSEKHEYKVFQGTNAAPEFIEHIFNKNNGRTAKSAGKRYLHAFNIDYDFHAIRPGITSEHPNVYIEYTLTDSKKFLFGEIRVDKRLTIKLNDLGKGNPANGSLKKYMKVINKMVYNDDGTPKTDDAALILLAALKYADFDNDKTFEKLSLDDYKKVNMYKHKNQYYYGTSKQDGIDEKDIPHSQRTKVKQLDMEHELKYLEIDVKSLIVIDKEQYAFKMLAVDTIELEEFMDKPQAISIPGFGKWLCEEFEGKYMTQTYRPGVSLEEYNKQNDSYTGAFVAGNKDITYLDEEVFKQMYPHLPYYVNGLPRLKSYDVHSMYPGVMSTGLPVGYPTHTKPEKGEYVTGHEVLFTEYGTKDITKRDRVRGLGGKLYDGKPEYACLNNSFFGTNFEVGVIPGNPAQSKVYIEDSLGKLFDTMCNHHAVIVATRYQRKSHDLVPFVERLYHIKCTTTDKNLKAAVKLVLNSLYGKMAERFKEKSIQGKSHIADIVFENPHYFQTLDEEQIKEIRDFTEEKQKRAKVKRNISPSLDIQFDSGFLVTRNLKGRYNSAEEETRESILAGCYITSRARGKLLSNIKSVIDKGNVFLYADTDSIKYLELTKCPLDTDKPDKDGNIKEELGKGGYEGSFTHFGHPNKLKKYFMYNKDTDHGMVKTSGVTKDYLTTPEGKFDLEMIKTIYHPDNRVKVKECRPISERNRLFQIVIKPKSDFYFVYEDMDLPETHILYKNVIKPC